MCKPERQSNMHNTCEHCVIGYCEKCVEELKKCARHFYLDAISFGPAESDKDWVAKNPWLEEEGA